MWQCNECGKKFHMEPPYCDACGATQGFRNVPDPEEAEAFFRAVEASFFMEEEDKVQQETQGYDDYDTLIRDFLKDEYKPVSKEVRRPFEEEDRLRQERKAREAREASLDQEYYDSLKDVVGEEALEGDDYYRDLEQLFQDKQAKGGHETTFGGLFDKEDTLENTFLKPGRKGKRQKAAPPSLKKASGKPSFPDISLLRPGGGKRPQRADRPEDKQKLLKILAGLGGVLVLMVVLMVILINSIVDSGDKGTVLPSEEAMLGFFDDIRGMEQEAFMADPSMVSFYGYPGDVAEKQEMLKNLYALVTAEDTVVASVLSIEAKGINRIRVEYRIRGSNMAVTVLEELLFRTTDNKKYQLDFADFVIRYAQAADAAAPAEEEAAPAP